MSGTKRKKSETRERKNRSGTYTFKKRRCEDSNQDQRKEVVPASKENSVPLTAYLHSDANDGGIGPTSAPRLTRHQRKLPKKFWTLVRLLRERSAAQLEG